VIKNFFSGTRIVLSLPQKSPTHSLLRNKFTPRLDL
jgi:hypothetical protein